MITIVSYADDTNTQRINGLNYTTCTVSDDKRILGWFCKIHIKPVIDEELTLLSSSFFIIIFKIHPPSLVKLYCIS